MSALTDFPTSGPSRFSQTITDILDRVEYRRVSLKDQLDPTYRLRYEAYRREAFVPINSDQIVKDEFDDLPNVHGFGVYIDGQLVSSLRFHHLTPECRHSLSYSIFSDVLDPILDAGHSVIDPGRFTADYEASLAYPALPFLTLRIAAMAVWHYGVKYCLNAVRPEHVAFYRRVFHSTPLAEARHYHGLSFPIVLYAAHIPVIYEGLLKRYPFFRSTAEEREKLFGPASRPEARVVPSARLAQVLGEPALDEWADNQSELDVPSASRLRNPDEHRALTAVVP